MFNFNVFYIVNLWHEAYSVSLRLEYNTERSNYMTYINNTRL